MDRLDSYFETIVEAMTEAVFAVHESGRFLYVNISVKKRMSS